MSTKTKQVQCDECGGWGVGKSMPECPWCSGTGLVDDTYVVRTHGWNGDFSFSEVEDVVEGLEAAKAKGEKAFAARGQNTLADGTPTIQWVEITGPNTMIGYSGSGWESA